MHHAVIIRILINCLADFKLTHAVGLAMTYGIKAFK